jgi:hypothetical protein
VSSRWSRFWVIVLLNVRGVCPKCSGWSVGRVWALSRISGGTTRISTREASATHGRNTSARVPPRCRMVLTRGRLPSYSTRSTSYGHAIGQIPVVLYACWCYSVVQAAWSTHCIGISRMWNQSQWTTCRNSGLLTVVRSSNGSRMEDWSGTDLTTST